MVMVSEDKVFQERAVTKQKRKYDEIRRRESKSWSWKDIFFDYHWWRVFVNKHFRWWWNSSLWWGRCQRLSPLKRNLSYFTFSIWRQYFKSNKDPQNTSDWQFSLCGKFGSNQNDTAEDNAHCCASTSGCRNKCGWPDSVNHISL